MARKTNNSSQSLTSAAAQALAIDDTNENSHSKTSNTKARKSPRALKNKGRANSHRTLSSDDEVQTDDEEGVDAEAEDDEGEPAVFAPSVRITRKSIEQTGLPDGAEQDSTHVPTATKGSKKSKADPVERGSWKQGSQADDSDDDYAALNDMSDSSGSEAGAEAGAEQDILQEEKNRHSSGLSVWDDLPDGILGAGDFFFDQHPEIEYAGSSILAGDTTDYQDWEGIPDTPIEASAPPFPQEILPSPRRVRFELQTSDHEPQHNPGSSYIKSILMAHANKGRKTLLGERFDQGDRAETHEDGAGDGGSASGYETDDGGTTDEEEPPVPPRGLFKAPHLLRRNSLSSLDTPPTSYVYTPPSLDTAFKVPSTPASHRRRGPKGPKVGGFQASTSRSYTVMDNYADNLLVRNATCPSPLSTPRHSRVGSFTSNSAPHTPRTPTISYATLAAAPDLSETEFSDAAASQRSLDPVLSVGPDFAASAGFFSDVSHSMSRIVQPSLARMDDSSIQGTQWSMRKFATPGLPESGSQFESDDQAQDDMDDSMFEDMIADLIVMPDDSSSEDEASASSPIGTPLDVETAASDEQPPSTGASPTSASSTPDINLFDGIGVTTRLNGNSQRSQSRTASSRPTHGLSLSGAIRSPASPKKRKLSESHGSRSPPLRASKRQFRSSPFIADPYQPC